MATMERAARQVDHVIVLMLENRSYDHMLGFMAHPSITPLQPLDHMNRVDPRDDSSRGQGVTPNGTFSIALDPPHSHLSIMKSFGRRVGYRQLPHYAMNGFVEASYEKAACLDVRRFVHWWRVEGLIVVVAAVLALLALAARPLGSLLLAVVASLVFLAGSGAVLYLSRRPREGCSDSDAAKEAALEVMRCQPEGHVPVLATLAREFAVCTNWFASVPGETWPNRNFAHAATSEGATGIEPGFYDACTIFERLEEADQDWRIYYDGFPQVLVFDALWRDGREANWHPFVAFFQHVADRDLPAYTFIEPRHQGELSNSQHPANNRVPGPDGHFDFQRGEELIRSIYLQLRSVPDLFQKTVLLVTYDEHGGLFDHCSPPTAMAPSRRSAAISLTRSLIGWFMSHPSGHFDFRRLGVRVPAVVVSPWIARSHVDDRTFDHSSIVATVRKLFAPHGRHLTDRDRRANTFEGLLALDDPRSGGDLPDLPPTLPLDPAEEKAIVNKPPTGPQEKPEFSTQLDALAKKVDQELDRRGAPEAEASLESLGRLEKVQVPNARTLARFEAEAERARSSRRSKPPG
jgi:hypothetical protein